MKRILALVFILLFTFMTTPSAFPAACPPTPRDAFGDTGLAMLDTGKQAVTSITRIDPHPPTLGMILIPEFHCADGEVVERLFYEANKSLRNHRNSVGTNSIGNLTVMNDRNVIRIMENGDCFNYQQC